MQRTETFIEGDITVNIPFINRNGKDEIEGQVVHSNSNGFILETTAFKDSLPNGKWVLFYPNTQTKKAEGFKKFGYYDGPYFEFHPNGQLAISARYKMGKLDGMFQAFDENSVCSFSVVYKDNKII